MPLPGTHFRPITPPTDPFHHIFPQPPPSPGVKPGWPQRHPWLCGCSLGNGNQPHQCQNHPDKTPKLRDWGLRPGMELQQPLELTACPAKGSVPALWARRAPFCYLPASVSLLLNIRGIRKERNCHPP